MTDTTPEGHTGNRSGIRRWGRFALHYVEMIIAMFAGMFALGLLWSALGFDPSYDSDPEPAYLLMAFDMSAGMAAWMRVRGHSWAPTLEMCAAMFVPVVPLFPLLWLGMIDGMAVMVAAHVLMFPLMLAAMFRRLDEYAH
ncbi:hypothetical protein OHB01_39410 [Microbispora hainanensis]|jgi:flagellar biosynthetic protein FliP|uniref:Flagellar biosynthetic protein FliP n=1 Tax=Microbispora hainanensis TaxID=568844 RepID=A0ABZ1T1W9_9ACTN|nr:MULTISPECIES: hypothetical protein [Microbispora]NJP23682.1 hypothetical protein [Microbispora sp. CL1-1]TQS15893.1 hypothetical protein FLW53_05570 [Microbispora sp. SCL1-1]